jgi:hypothetical protein
MNIEEQVKQARLKRHDTSADMLQILRDGTRLTPEKLTRVFNLYFRLVDHLETLYKSIADEIRQNALDYDHSEKAKNPFVDKTHSSQELKELWNAALEIHAYIVDLHGFTEQMLTFSKDNNDKVSVENQEFIDMTRKSDAWETKWLQDVGEFLFALK